MGCGIGLFNRLSMVLWHVTNMGLIAPFNLAIIRTHFVQQQAQHGGFSDPILADDSDLLSAKDVEMEIVADDAMFVLLG